MKKHISHLFCSVLFFLSFTVYSQQLINYNGGSYFLNGVNIPWHSFNLDFGSHYQFGSHYDPVFFDSVFTECQNYGVNCVRVWLHNDGATTPEFDIQGNVTGLDSNFFSNLDNFFQLAANHNIMVIPVLWSFPMMNNDYAFGTYGGMHANLIQDTTKTNTYITNALIPIVTRYTNQCNLLAWEIINEPEWATDVLGNDTSITQHVSMNEMQRFVGMLATAIHNNSSKMCTLGAVALKYNSSTLSFPTLCVGNFWTNSALQSAYNNSNAYLDFYQVHYYDWMRTIYQNFDPYDYAYSHWNLDKPMLIGESKGNSSYHTPTDQLYNAFVGNFAGVLFWSFVGGDGNGDFNTVKSALQAFRNAAPSLVDFQGCISTNLNKDKKLTQISAFPNPTAESITISGVQSAVIKIITMQGEVLKEIYTTINNSTIELNTIPKGFYLLQISDGVNFTYRKIEKL